MNEIERINKEHPYGVDFPGYRVESKAVAEVKLKPYEVPWWMFALILSLGVVLSVVFGSWWFTLGAVLGSAAAPVLPANRVSERDQNRIARVVARNRIEHVKREYAHYEILIPDEIKKVLRQQRNRMNMPDQWTPGTPVPVDQALSPSNPSGIAAVKTGRRRAVVIEQRLIPEDQIWMDHFRKAMDLR